MVRVRAAKEIDAEAVGNVWASVASEGEWIGTELPLRGDWADRFNSALVNNEQAWLVAELDDVVIGAIFMNNERGLGHLGMAVVAAHRGRGVGRALVASCIDWARDQLCHKVVLEVWPHNVRARRLYEWAGFQEEGYLKRHYRRRNGALWDAVTMGLVLDTTSPGRPDAIATSDALDAQPELGVACAGGQRRVSSAERSGTHQDP